MQRKKHAIILQSIRLVTVRFLVRAARPLAYLLILLAAVLTIALARWSAHTVTIAPAVRAQLQRQYGGVPARRDAVADAVRIMEQRAARFAAPLTATLPFVSQDPRARQTGVVRLR